MNTPARVDKWNNLIFRHFFSTYYSWTKNIHTENETLSTYYDEVNIAVMIDNNKNKNEECKDEGKEKWTCPPVKNVTHPLRYYEFTQEEIKALEECDKESFYQRCVPFSSLFAAITYAGVKNGILRRNPHFGAVPKVMLAALVGYSYGRLSYISECELKLRQLPANSYLGNVMRQYHLENHPPKDYKNAR